jgi:hypothetical protein
MAFAFVSGLDAEMIPARVDLVKEASAVRGRRGLIANLSKPPKVGSVGERRGPGSSIGIGLEMGRRCR